MARALDAVDRDIVASLWKDARRSNGSIAAELGVSEATVRARIKRMREERAIQIKAVANIERLQRDIAAQHGYEIVEHSLVLYVRPREK